MRDEALHTRLATAEASLDDLRRELAELRVLAEHPIDEQEPAAPADDLPWWEQSEPPMAEPEPIPELEPPLVPPDPPRRTPTPPREPSDWDRDI